MDSEKEKDNRALLEWELSLNSADLRSHAWYHGSISRSKAESMLVNEGNFLVRDSSSRANDYVLSSRLSSGHLHFVINRIVIQPNTVYERIQYTFEDDYFDTVADLITFYVGNRRPISKASGAIISKPVNRLKPLSSEKSISTSSSERSLDRIYGRYAKGLHGRIGGKNSRLQDEEEDDENDNLPGMNSKFAAYLGRMTKKDGVYSAGHFKMRDSRSSSGSSRLSLDRLYIDRKSDTQEVAVDKSKADEEESEDEFHAYITLKSEIQSSVIDPLNFRSFLLFRDNNPLEPMTRGKIESILLETGPLILANHLTRTDLDFFNHISEPRDLGFGLSSGLELLLLPHGSQYRLDLLDRHNCLQYFICHSILSVTDLDIRVTILDRWIRVALELKTALGNLYGFGNIMAALTSSWIMSLSDTWDLLRKRHTDSALAFDTGLRPVMKGLQEGTEPSAPNTTIPNIIMICQILTRYQELMDEYEKKVADQQASDEKTDPSHHYPDGLQPNENSALKMDICTLDLPFESTTTDYGFQAISSHLENGRSLVENVPLFRRNGQIALDGCNFEELLLDMFKTEFHRLHLWGYKRADADSAQRYAEIQAILKTLQSGLTNSSS